MSYYAFHSVAFDTYHLSYSPLEIVPGMESGDEAIFTDGRFVPEGEWTAFASVFQSEGNGGVGLTLLTSAGPIEFLVHPNPPADVDGVYFIPYNDEQIVLRVEHYEDDDDSVLVLSHSPDHTDWVEVARFTSQAPVTEVGIALRYDRPDYPASGQLAEVQLLSGIWEQGVVEEIWLGDTEIQGQVAARDAPPQAGVTSTLEPLVHAIVGAQFGDLEFDVGKSVRWTEWFCDNLFILDVNLGTPRYWIVNWTETFRDAEHRVTGVNYFVLPAQFRADQWDKYKSCFGVPHDDDWILWVDAHEGLGLDNRTLPNDYDIEPFKSFLWREIQRADDAGQKYAVLPYYVFLRSDNIVNVTYGDPPGNDPEGNPIPAVEQAISTPYYQAHQGMRRLWKASELKKPDFDWSLLDTPEPWEVKAGTGTPYAPGYLDTTVGTVSIPDAADLNITTNVRFTCKIRDTSTESTTSRSVVTKGNSGASLMSYRLGHTYLTGWNITAYPSGTPAPQTIVHVATRSNLGLTPPGTDRYVGVTLTGVGATTALTLRCQVLESVDGVTWTNEGTQNTAIAANTISNDSATPLILGLTMQSRIYWAQMEEINRAQFAFPGTGANYLSVPDSAPLNITGDLTIVWDMDVPTWTPAVSGWIVAKGASQSVGGSSYGLAHMTAGTLQLWIDSPTGLQFLGSPSLTSLPLGRRMFAVCLDVDNGSAGKVHEWLTSTDQGVTWTSLARTTAATATSIKQLTQPLIMGGRGAGTASFIGKIHRVQIRDGIGAPGAVGGTVVFDMRGNDAGVTPAALTFPAFTGQTVTVNQVGTTIVEALPDAVTWRFDANERTGTGTTYTDPRGRTWTLTNASAIVPAVDAVTAVPAAKMQIVSYGYAHWNLQDIEPPETTVPALTEENDDGWRMRKLLSMVRPIPGLPVGDTWVSPASDPVGLAGPWAPADTNHSQVLDPVTRAPMAQPVTPDASLAGLIVPLYDCALRLNMRDGVWYEDRVSGNIPLKWDSASGTWTTDYDPATWADDGVKSYDPDAVPTP